LSIFFDKIDTLEQFCLKISHKGAGMKEHEEKVAEVTEEAVKEETTVVAEEKNEEVQEAAQAESSEETEVEEAAKEESEGEEEAQEDNEKSLDEDAMSQIENMNKHDAAVLLIKKTKHIVDDTEKQLDACKLLLQDDLKSYDDAKAALKERALDESESLLEELGYGQEEEEEVQTDDVVFEAKDEVPPFYVRDISSGKFSSFLMALIVGLITFAGMVYFAASKVGVALDTSKVPSQETATTVLGWYATLFGGKPDLFLGGGFVVGVVLIVMWIVYAIRVSSKANSNLAFAKEQLEKAQEYATHKGSCKEEMDKVDVHMNDAIKVLKTYEIVLQEQNGKLKRILHIEGVKEVPTEYHEKSQREMEDTHMLVQAIKNFIGTSMSEEGKLSGKSTMFLHSAKSKLQKFLDRHY
jgi:hypothetical protein